MAEQTETLTYYMRYSNLERLIESVRSTAYYFYVGDHVAHANSEPKPLHYNVSDSYIYPYQNMIMGKKIMPQDILPMIRRIPWESKVFDYYDQGYDLHNHTNPDRPETDFYCMVNEGSFYHVWKCLDNNNDAISTYQPAFAEGSEPDLYQTSDGYRWKYMTSVASSTVSKFATNKYFPLIANTNIQLRAVNGKIDIIRLEHLSYGRKYDNYIDGTFTANDIRMFGNPSFFNIANNVVKPINGFYTGCILYITAGVGQGQYKTIIDFVANSSGNIIRLENQFIVTPQNGSKYEIRPRVNVVGNGQETVPCVARALVNSINSNSIYRVEVLQPGKDYVNATASVIANAVVGLDPANIALLRPIIGPYGGHGYDIFRELYCHTAEFAITLANTENNTLPTSNRYQQIGVIKDPLFQDVELTLANSASLFTSGEELKVVFPQQINTKCSINVGSTQIFCNTADIINQMMLTSALIMTTPDHSLAQYVRVAQITNSTTIQAYSNLRFSCTEAVMYEANVTANCLCSGITNSTVLVVTNCPSSLTTGTNLIGTQSGATGRVVSMRRNSVVKGFDTFIQVYKYDTTLISGMFLANEQVVQGNNYGYVHHTEGTTNISIFISNMTKLFVANTTPISGVTSRALATLTKRYNPEVIFGSGTVQYVENLEMIDRANTQSESFQIALTF
jgi:hypothetical protein